MGKVLIVDDNESILEIIHSVHEKYKNEFEFITANSGEKALEVLKVTRIDLIITDLVMPHMDGLTLLAHVNEKYPNTLCIAMTGYPTVNVAKTLPDNLLRLIQKPLKVHELITIIKETLKIKPPVGTVNGISIASFLQLIEIDEKSCTLDVTLPDNKEGTFLFKGGDLYDAFFEDLTGEKAALALLINNEKASFTLNSLPRQEIPRRINRRIMELLMEAARRRDVYP